MNFLQDNKGFTLLEAIASLLLITIILITFFGFFLQSKKTNSLSETITETTYIAQKEMEQIYLLSKTSSLSNLSEGYLPNYKLIHSPNNGCIKEISGGDTEFSYIYEKITENYTSKVTISPLCNYGNAGNVLIEITDSIDKKKAIIENVYIWRKEKKG